MEKRLMSQGTATLEEKLELSSAEPEVSIPSVCIYGEFLTKTFGGTVGGGAELQIMLLARALARHGAEVTIVEPADVPASQPIQGLTIQGFAGWNKGIPGIRFFTRRLPALIKRLKESRAGIFYVRGFSFIYLIPMAVANRMGAKFVLAVAHDTDLMGFRERYQLFYRNNATLWRWLASIIPNEIASRILLRKADVVLVQHKQQGELLSAAYGRTGVQVNNLVDEELFSIRRDDPHDNVVIVGEFSARKNLRAMLPVIRELPEVTFEFIGSPHDAEGRAVYALLKECPNVLLRGSLPRAETVSAIARARVLANTSAREGFPNVFLEAWALGTPVVALNVDPGGVIAAHQLGYCCHGDMTKFSQLLRQTRFELDAEHIRSYVLTHHLGNHIIDVFARIMRLEA